jgi:PAS domain S-box-containing protein
MTIMAGAGSQSDALRAARLLDENEQLRTALESSLEENARLVDDRDRLLRRVTALARELQAIGPASAAPSPRETVEPPDAAEAQLKRSQTEEELRLAVEELQVLAEELEVANSGLQRANEELEERVQARTRELVAANADLRRTELRLNTLIHGMPQLVWRAVDGGQWTWCSPQWSDLTGQPQEASHRMGWLEALHPDDRRVALDAWAMTPAAGALSFAGRICDVLDGRYRHFQVRASPARMPDGAVLEWLGTCTDVDEIIRLQEQQSVLVGELQHRTRNLMAVVHAVTIRTIKGSRTLDEFRRCIDDRMGALSRVQGLLSRRGSQRIAFDTLLREELSAHVDLDREGDGSQVVLSGPAGVPLATSLVQTIALALHELATNAVKYGVLSASGGLLTVTWKVIPTEQGTSRLHIDWRETGVRSMPREDEMPRGGGYGRELIERALPYQLGALTSYGFTGDGVHCTIEVDVPMDKAPRETVHART